MMCFTLEDARAELIPLMPPGKVLLDETDGAWDKTFPLSDRVEHEKVSFRNRYGIALAADLYRPKGAEGRLPAVAVSGPFGAVKTGEIEDKFGEKVTTYKFEPLLDNEGKPVVREITTEDVDRLGEAVMSTIFNG